MATTPTPPTEIAALVDALEFATIADSHGSTRATAERQEAARSALLSSVSALAERAAAAERERDEANERARISQRDRADALNVRSRDGLLSSEWLLRTGKAERERDEAEARAAQAEAEIARLRPDPRLPVPTTIGCLCGCPDDRHGSETPRHCSGAGGPEGGCGCYGYTPGTFCDECGALLDDSMFSGHETSCIAAVRAQLAASESSERALRDGIRALAAQAADDAGKYERAAEIAEGMCVGAGGALRAAMGSHRAFAADLRALVDPVNAEKKEG